MSHFSVAVILPDGQPFDEDAVAQMMAPYDENDEIFREGSRWDWWVIGGRWDGAIGNPTNVCFMRDVAQDYTPFAFIKPDGTWVEESRMGWWGMTIPDEHGEEDKGESRDSQWEKARKDHATCVVVGLDAHV